MQCKGNINTKVRTTGEILYFSSETEAMYVCMYDNKMEWIKNYTDDNWLCFSADWLAWTTNKIFHETEEVYVCYKKEGEKNKQLYNYFHADWRARITNKKAAMKDGTRCTNKQLLFTLEYFLSEHKRMMIARIMVCHEPRRLGKTEFYP